jgi:hypothetical protein
MGYLSKMSDREKVEFLMEALLDAAAALRFEDCVNKACRYESYVREMRGEQQTKEDSHG